MLAIAAASVAVGALPVSKVHAQDRQPGVSLGLQYRPGQKTGLLVLPITGASGDSISAILSRDLDYSDRFTIIPTSSVAAAAPVNYALYQKLGADGVLQGIPTHQRVPVLAPKREQSLSHGDQQGNP